MRPFFFLIVGFQLALGLEVHDRTKREAESCVGCLTNFNTERSAASSPKERCGALKNYITCRTNTSTSWPGCDVTHDDGVALRNYYYAIQIQDCVVSDTCKCQMEHWFNTGDYHKSRYYMQYMQCLYNANMPACDGVTSPLELIETAKRFKDDAFRNKSECSSKYETGYNPDNSYSCSLAKEYISCLGEVAIGNDGPLLNATEQADMQAKLNKDQHCELKMTDTCQCETAFLTQDYSDICGAARQFVACTNNSYMGGCNGDVDSVRSLAKLLKRQHCSYDQEYDCNGAELCYITMESMSRESIPLQTSSCTSLESYTTCLKTSIPQTCSSINKTVDYLEEIMDSTMRCYELEWYVSPSGMYSSGSGMYSSGDSGWYFTNNQWYNTDSGMYSTDPGMYSSGDSGWYFTNNQWYNTDSGMYSTDPGMYSSGDSGWYFTNNQWYNTDSGMYSTDSGMYNTDPGMYNTDSGMYNTDPGMYNTDSGMYNASPGTLSGDKYLMLLSAVATARLEAEETLHAAEEAVDAIMTAEKVLQSF